jgi:hypothetical protein
MSATVDGGVDPDRVSRLDAGDDVTQAELVGASETDVLPAALFLQLRLVGVGVGLDHLGLRDREHSRRRLAADGGGDRPVDDADVGQRQRATHRGDSARDPDVGLQRLHDPPGQGEPVLQVEHVGDGAVAGGRVNLTLDGDLGRRELPQLRRALTAEPAEPIAPVVGRVRVAVQDRPVGEDLEVLHLDGPTPTGRRCGPGQSGRGVQISEWERHALSLIEHTFDRQADSHRGEMSCRRTSVTVLYQTSVTLLVLLVVTPRPRGSSGGYPSQSCQGRPPRRDPRRTLQTAPGISYVGNGRRPGPPPRKPGPSPKS